MKKFSKSFTQQEAIPEDAIEDAIALLKTGRLHRYNALDDEKTSAELSGEFSGDKKVKRIHLKYEWMLSCC